MVGRPIYEEVCDRKRGSLISLQEYKKHMKAYIEDGIENEKTKEQILDKMDELKKRRKLINFV